RTRSGWYTESPNSSAAIFTGGWANWLPRPFGRSGWVNTPAISCPARTSARRVGTANSGVPRKTAFIGTELFPLSGFLQLLDLSPDDVALQSAQVIDEKDSV